MNDLIEISEHWTNVIKPFLAKVDFTSTGLEEQNHLKIIFAIQVIAGVDVCASNLNSDSQETVEAYKNLLIDGYKEEPFFNWEIAEAAKFFKIIQAKQNEEWFVKIRMAAAETCFNYFESDGQIDEASKILTIFDETDFISNVSRHL